MTNIYIKRNYYSSSSFFLVFLLEKKYLHSFDINYSFPWLSLSYVSIPSFLIYSSPQRRIKHDTNLISSSSIYVCLGIHFLANTLLLMRIYKLSENSIIVDASKYIQELKHKVERLNQDIITTLSQSNSGNKTSSWPQIEVETLEKGFLINVYAERSCPGLLVAILQVLEDLGLNVLEARVSCNDTFRLQAFGGEDEEAIMNAQVVTEAIFEAIKNWSESNEQG